ncbi:MAG TPA: hypothetical protein VFF06_07665, partial [Polyangia bacterium]|nr:hypothetical protein [Polyangia bacterium]
CATRTSSVCIANSCPTCGFGDYCAPDVTVPNPPNPTCQSSSACHLSINYNAYYCCPSMGGPNYCTSTNMPYTGCLFRPYNGGGSCAADSDCTQMSAGRPVKCMLNGECVIQ